MLSQKIAKLVLSASIGDDQDLKQIPQFLELYNFSLLRLQNGGEILNLTIPKAPESMDNLFKKNWDIWTSIKKSAETIISDKHNIEALNRVKQGSDELLDINDEITYSYEGYFTNKIIFLKRLLIIMLIIDLIIIIIGWILTNLYISIPLKHLSKTVIKIGSGDFNQKILTKHTNDEIGELANSFNT
ncbi:MAG: HAMP domain-containing protein, partial [Nitrospirae bacterium]|nr:HAMP domain-containing protein [Nitrospirota bacterium]